MKALAFDQNNHALAKQVGLAALLSILISLCSRVIIPLPFTPVPVVFQNILCLAIGLFFGKRIGALTVAFFLLQGLVGLPVFSSGGSGIAWFFGPTGGYLVGYLAGTYLTGYLYEKRSDFLGAAVSLFSGMSVIYLFGIAHLSFFVGLNKAIVLGFLPFILLDVAKMLFFLSISRATKKAA